MKLTREEALELHRQMWTDMKKELGDRPLAIDRFVFKEKWLREHFRNTKIKNNCFLCEYVDCVDHVVFDTDCKKICPIMWDTDDGSCSGAVNGFVFAFACAPISWVLAQKERCLNDV